MFTQYCFGEEQMIYVVFLIYSVLSSLGMVLVKSGGSKSEFSVDAVSISLNVNWQAITGLLMYICSFLLWMFILQKFRLTYISSIAYGIVFVLTSIFSVLILHETIPTKDIIGFLIILSGVLICTI